MGTSEMNNMIELFEKIFSQQFWSNTMIVATKYSFDEENEKKRKEQRMTEESWAKDKEKNLHELFQFEDDVKTVFIDSHYNINPNKPSIEKETEKFNHYTEILWQFANAATPFELI